MLPSLSFCFTLFLCKLTGSVPTHCTTSQEQGLAVPICQGWISLPSSCPRVLPVVSQTKRWQYPPVLCCLLDFQLEKCMYFPPAAFWKAGPWLRQCVLLSFTCMCYPKATFVQRVPTICLIIFSSCFFAYALSGRIILSAQWKLCLGTAFKAWILLRFSLSKKMFLPSESSLDCIASLCAFQVNTKSPLFPRSFLSTYSCCLLRRNIAK